MALLRRFYERYGELLGARALHSFDELERVLKRNGFLTKYLDRVLALPKPEKLVARLLTSPAALGEAADGILDRDEQQLLLRDRPEARGRPALERARPAAPGRGAHVDRGAAARRTGT